jgi:hypothetical protein
VTAENHEKLFPFSLMVGLAVACSSAHEDTEQTACRWKQSPPDRNPKNAALIGETYGKIMERFAGFPRLGTRSVVRTAQLPEFDRVSPDQGFLLGVGPTLELGFAEAGGRERSE